MGSARKHIVIDARIRRSSTGRYVDRLLEHLQDIGSDARFTVMLQPGDPWQPRVGHFSTVSCPFPQFSLNPLADLRFARLLRSLRPDLVHFTMTQQPISYFGNIVTTTHDLTMLHFIRAGAASAPVFWMKKLGYRFLFWQAHKKSRRIIVPTKFVADALAARQPFIKKKTVVTYEASEPPLEDAAMAPKDAPASYILYVGSAFPHKNLSALVDAFGLVRAKYPDLHLLFAGKKEFYYRELDEYIERSGFAAGVKTLGFVSDAELKWLYQNARSYVFPSLSEGFGLPGLEAMAHGCPVVSSEATCLPEVYGSAAKYFDPRDRRDISEAIGSVLSSSALRNELIENGKVQLQKYSWQKMAAETMKVYNECLKNQPHGKK